MCTQVGAESAALMLTSMVKGQYNRNKWKKVLYPDLKLKKKNFKKDPKS